MVNGHSLPIDSVLHCEIIALSVASQINGTDLGPKRRVGVAVIPYKSDYIDPWLLEYFKNEHDELVMFIRV